MATVRVLATRLGNNHVPVARLAYRAQIFDDARTTDATWTCTHDHGTPIEAQSCGLQYLNDLLAGPQEVTPAGA